MGAQIYKIHYKRFVYKNQQIAIKNLRFCGWNAMQSKLNRCVGNDLCVVPQDLCGFWQDVEVSPPQGVRIAVGLFRFLRANTVRPLRWGGCRARACSRRFCSCELRRARNARPYGVCITVRLCENQLCSGGRGNPPLRIALCFTRTVGTALAAVRFRGHFFSENRHPFVCFADISPIRGITPHCEGIFPFTRVALQFAPTPNRKTQKNTQLSLNRALFLNRSPPP